MKNVYAAVSERLYSDVNEVQLELWWGPMAEHCYSWGRGGWLVGEDGGQDG